jgi:hypothetical protein
MLLCLFSVSGSLEKIMSRFFTPFFRASSSPVHRNPGEIG